MFEDLAVVLLLEARGAGSDVGEVPLDVAGGSTASGCLQADTVVHICFWLN